jgi:hypothetical protein
MANKHIHLDICSTFSANLLQCLHLFWFPSNKYIWCLLVVIMQQIFVFRKRWIHQLSKFHNLNFGWLNTCSRWSHLKYLLPTYGPAITIDQFTDVLTAMGKIEYEGKGQIHLIKVVKYVQGPLNSQTTRISLSSRGMGGGAGGHI